MQLKWDQFERAQKLLNQRASSFQAKSFGLADDLAAIREAFGEVQRNFSLLAHEYESMKQKLNELQRVKP